MQTPDDLAKVLCLLSVKARKANNLVPASFLPFASWSVRIHTARAAACPVTIALSFGIVVVIGWAFCDALRRVCALGTPSSAVRLRRRDLSKATGLCAIGSLDGSNSEVALHVGPLSAATSPPAKHVGEGAVFAPAAELTGVAGSGAGSSCLFGIDETCADEIRVHRRGSASVTTAAALTPRGVRLPAAAPAPAGQCDERGGWTIPLLMQFVRLLPLPPLLSCPMCAASGTALIAALTAAAAGVVNAATGEDSVEGSLAAEGAADISEARPEIFVLFSLLWADDATRGEAAGETAGGVTEEVAGAMTGAIAEAVAAG
eukprot:CAMPEP_0119346138 /NCGR_PEP_ID=MMETSP1333-20130426/107852_1 /TAXON_ID=418940 /ORGANISM="Scyphosphaera apsteinii, Strain RCC1455" /LENGTH=316 /DNA_ID=CAMNT_0007358637 /DNA_START=822 /DNA_END=1769 /DNA_ORIENTATION=-